MPRSVRLHPERKPEVLRALERNGFLTQGQFASHIEISLSTVNNFINSRRVYVSKFEEICHVLGLEQQEMVKPLSDSIKIISKTQNDLPPVPLYACDDNWVGREKLVAELTEKLTDSFRLLLILGLTGVGKTALAERIALERPDWFGGNWQQGFIRASFDNPSQATDFLSTATQWLQAWGIKIPFSESQPATLLERVLDYLKHQQVLVLIDSLENLLSGNEEEGWGNFLDPWWERFFLGVLSAQSFVSRIIITSQELPLQIVQQRYAHFWHRHILMGLNEAEQEALFEITGFDIEAASSDKPLLMRLGKAYQGHPLVLRVVIGEIWESFEGDVAAYWEEVKSKIEDVERALAEAEADIKKAIGIDDNWKLHKLTFKVRLEVNRQRLRAAFDRLSSQVPDAYWLLCAASVYRTPVQVQGWLLQLANLVKRLEGKTCSEERQERALLELSYRFLVEEALDRNRKRVLGQHNLVRSLALERYQQLVESWKE
ncbi:AAA family ATPase [Oscillatoria sp. FACHB-1406]|uniref:AAA family ATPase n=1 Tax=Oscillatoria sp. FACHB-1406 TaxID=2692846 RepID=UPI001684DF87|nr:AAA family ATPase [Oscillatoria sp. FACHB-1406]MBD2580126.1 ATP-binding protein [Oscillatoria sp. FACHB-1406]